MTTSSVAISSASRGAIAAGRAEEAERLMSEHVQEYAGWVRGRRPESMEEVFDWR